jgi:ferric-dicitrate binding protein FerR (iron transport regulator)
MDNYAPNSRRIARLLAEVAGPPSTPSRVDASHVKPRKRTVRGLSSVVTVLFVAALAGVLWFRGEHVVLASQVETLPDTAAGSTTAARDGSSLSAMETGVPSASVVFASQPPSAADDIPGPPTF